ncbi:MAG: hypothetical protein KDD69_06505 [Bdellovibrionales bacterium]|nr:hypothetical protein [Bdellovibrionales bacterium]
MESETPPVTEPSESETANALLTCGATFAAVGAGMALIVGVVCPFCVVAAPSLIAGGAVMKLMENRKENGNE